MKTGLEAFMELAPPHHAFAASVRIRSNEDTDAEVQRFMSGRKVRIVNLQNRVDLNQRVGIVLHSPMVNEKLAVRIFLPRCQTISVRVPLRNLVPCSEEPVVKVLWAYATHSNNGKGCPPMKETANEAMNSKQSWLQQKEYKMSDLLEECRRQDFIQHETELCQTFGLHIACFAQPYVWEQEATGKNNRAGTFFTSDSKSCIAKDVVIGPCVLVRLSPQTGEPVNFHYREALRALHFIEDLKMMYSDGIIEDMMHEMPTREICRDLVTCYPYYDIGCVMDFGGFTGPREMKRKEDGTYEKSPADMQPIPDGEN